MKIKKYLVSSMPEAMKVIKEELGDNAVILNSKTVQIGGFMGLFTKKRIEVIAAIDEKLPAKEPVSAPIKRETVSIIPPQVEKKDTLLEEVEQLKTMMHEIKGNQSTSSKPSYPPAIRQMDGFMEDQEIEPHLRDECVARLLEKWYMYHGTANDELVRVWLQEIICEKIGNLSYGRISNECKYVNVVGPTGVGKTTTLAKIAAEEMLKYHKKIAFITTDTYRISAIEQLKTYATILNVPIEVCYNLEEFNKAIDMFKDFDLVLIDTAGRNFTDQKYVDGLKEIIDFTKTETLLVLSLTSKYKDMQRITEQFQSITINRFVFTKTDETLSYGPMLNMMTSYNLGVAYVTNGQNVPDDILEGNPRAISNILMERCVHDGSSRNS